MSLDTDYRCPHCHAKMETGFVPTGGGMHWYRRREASVDFAEAIPGTHTWMRRARMPAWRCKSCRLLMFRYGHALDPDTGEHVVEKKDQDMLQEQSDGERGAS